MADGYRQAELVHLAVYRVNNGGVVCHATQIHSPEKVDYIDVQQTLIRWNVLEVDQVCHRPQSIASQYRGQKLGLQRIR